MMRRLPCCLGFLLVAGFVLAMIAPAGAQVTVKPELTKCPVERTICPVVETECPVVKTKCPVVPTECPGGRTQCPVVKTECPATLTVCPATLTECPVVETRCPVVKTKCPVTETQCPVEQTKCPPVATECPPEPTRCPTVATRCPVEQTRCPPVTTECPLEPTRCPTAATKCPVEQTRCPPVPTECPAEATRCPPITTRCPVEQTKCPPVTTECPAVKTECPVVRTECPVVPTECPGGKTQCPAVKTECPATLTECPVVETRCPTVTTKCPVNETVCPAVATKCPAVRTECPPVATECPPEPTRCPVVKTQCPPITTECPAVKTECPAARTECPVLKTECPATLTECPVVETKCPTVTTRCPVKETVCPAVATECPAVRTECPVARTECPVVKTECPVVPTECPGGKTQCPAVKTLCPATLTECPVVETKCPAERTKCPPVATECPIVETRCPTVPTKCPVVKTECPVTATQCPVVETRCPTVTTKCPSTTTRCPVVKTQCPVAPTKCPAKLTACPPVLTRCPPGDMVIGQFRDPTLPGSYGPGSIFTVDTTSGSVYTIAQSFTTAGSLTMGPNWIEMASDNVNFMVGCLPGGASSTILGNGVYFHHVGADGSILSTLVADTTAGIGYLNSFDLDGDGTWILGGGTRVWSYDENTSTYATLYDASSPTGTVNALVLDPALPAGDIVLGKFNTSSSTTANLVEADRSGIISTIATAGPTYVSGIKVDYMTGDYLCSAFGPLADGTGGEFSRVTKAGVYTSLNTGVTTMYRANAIYVDKQHLVWILTYDCRTVVMPPANPNTLVCSLYKVDQKGVFITLYNFGTTLTRNNFAPSGLTRYGSRNVVCNGSGRPGTTVKVLFSSRKAADASKAYQLACSFGYTNGIKFANGEYLDLSFDVLLFLTANNILPTVFQNFGGLLDSYGEATAAVHIPAALPPGLGIPIYVSGIVIDPMVPGGVSTVGNTHWFTLR